MLKGISQTQTVMRVWLAALVTIVVLSVMLGARWSTTALLFVMGVTPMVVAFLLVFDTSLSMTPHELLHAVDNQKDDKR